MSAARAVLRALLIAILMMAAAEALARATRPDYAEFDSYREPRNRHSTRGWPEYTAPPVQPRTTARRLVVAISNSQGVLRERADGREAWPARLEQDLRDAGVDAQVLNWSVPGGAGVEMTILAARALQHQPDLILLVSYNNNFGPYWRTQPLSFHHSDATLLAYHDEVRARLSAEFLRAIGAWDPLGWLGAHSGLVWWRNRLADRASGWRLEVAEPQHEGLSRGRKFAINAISRFPLLEDFVGVLDRGGVRGLIVAMPLARGACEGWENAASFARRATELADASATLGALDATALVPDEEFYGARHLRPAGHARFAAWLAPHVQALLAED